MKKRATLNVQYVNLDDYSRAARVAQKVGLEEIKFFLRQLDFFLTRVYIYVNCISCRNERYYIEGIFIPWNSLSPAMAGARGKNF